MLRVLITGVSGFIGGHLVQQALDRGYSVTGVVRASSDRSRLSDPRLNLLELPWADTAAMVQILKAAGPFDVVIHNAGITKALSEADYNRVNVDQTLRLADAWSESAGPNAKFIYVSSLAALGPAAAGAERVQPEQHPNPLTPYGASKGRAEHALAARSERLSWVIAQPTAVYGPWERDILSFIKMVNMGIAPVIGSSTQRLSFIHVHDVARAILELAENPKCRHKTYILSDGRDYQATDLREAVKQALNRRRVMRVPIPGALLWGMAGMQEIAGRWKGVAPPLNRKKIPELTAENWLCDDKYMKMDTTFEPQFDLYEGMRHTIEWYKGQGWM
jgi:UDP-glucose 4-epimerase